MTAEHDTTTPPGDRVGFLGLGAMGLPMARRLLGAGVPVCGYDPDPEARERAAAAGAGLADSPRAAAEDTDVVLCSLPHPDVLLDVLLGGEGVVRADPAPAVVVDLSTSGPSAVRRCADGLAARGVAVVDAPVGKGPWAAESGDLTLLLGGEPDACARVEPLLRRLGSTVHHCGPVGAGQAVKLANNLVSCATMAVVAEGYALAVRAGADPGVLLEVMPQTSADSWQLRHTLIGKVVADDLAPMFKLRLAHKDLALVTDLAERLGTTVGCTRAALDLYTRALDAGYGELDWGAVALVAEPSLASGRRSGSS